MNHLVAPVQKVYKQLKLFSSGYGLVIPSVAAFLICFALSFVSGSLIIQPQGTKAITGLGLVTATTMSLTSSGNVSLPITPTSTGALASGSHNLTASTNVPTGYNLALTTDTTSTLPTTTGSFISPTALVNNSWGYALASTGNFDGTYATPTPSTASKWANPSEGVTIKSTTNSVTSDNTTIYYGVKVDTTQTSGTYSNTVRYTATANTPTIPAPTITSITPNSGTTAGGTAITIVGTGFTVNNESVTTGVTIGGSACTSVSISSNTPTTGQDTIYCNTPAHAAGVIDVVVTTWRSTATTANGYTYIAPANVTLVSPNVASTIPGTESGPAFTIVGTGFTGATSVTIGDTACTSFEVVSDTHIFCKASNTMSTTGNKTIVVAKSNIANTGTVNIAYNSTNYPTLQARDTFTRCTTTAKLFRDTRDSQLYYVKKLQDQKCWMIDNLKYANYGDLSQEAGKYLTVDGTNTQSTANSDVAKYVDPGATGYCEGSTNMPTNTNTRCGLLYNWYTATNGTGTYIQNTGGDQVTGNICPANFRLPSSMSDGITATSNGTSYAAADFPVLNASMNAGALTAGSTTSYPTNWQSSGAWSGVYSGFWTNNFSSQGNRGGFWPSTVNSATFASDLNFQSDYVGPGNDAYYKYAGFAVRCVMDEPLPIDTYPTTGWTGDAITITGKGFTNVTSVTVGGTPCTNYQILSDSRLTCVLPSKTAGTSNNIAVTVSGVNITPQATYTHMKITYFNPSSNTVNVGGTNYTFYPNGFTNANCSMLAPSNAAIGSTPPASMVYVRDTRNKQTYKIKRMVDNKCWMVDNLKYISTTTPANVDGSTGMTYNAVGFNTVDGSDIQSSTNSNKAFYNNPMSNSYCYGTTNMPANTLTSCGYLYNWYAATNGTGTHAQITEGTNATGNICPANFRLPSAMSDGNSATSNGTSYAAADFAVLNASMNAGSLTTGSVNTSYQAGWRPSGAWGGTYTSSWNNSFARQGSGIYWSSTVDYHTSYSFPSMTPIINIGARNLYFSNSTVNPGTYLGNANTRNYAGHALRCVTP